MYGKTVIYDNNNKKKKNTYLHLWSTLLGVSLLLSSFKEIIT